MAITIKREQRGSVAIEMVFVLPLYVLLWLLCNHAYTLYVAAITNIATVRDCAWQFAVNGCKSPPGNCTTQGPTPGLPPDGPSLSGLSRVASSFPALSPSLIGPYDKSLTIKKIISIPAPTSLGFPPVRLTSTYGSMCDEAPTVKWTALEVFEAHCNLLGKFCQ
ncbi:MAG: hypothetical protein QOI66_2988 [Myxococcales bacterium]|jgi:hypothetical protein|nr:hypothetical protein [Myxococcales bacterium]